MIGSKINMRRVAAALLCIIIVFGMVLTYVSPAMAYADYVTVSTTNTASYFQTYGSNGVWKDIMTPQHTINQTGQVAYCLQPAMDSPQNSGYNTTEGRYYYDYVTMIGLQAILENGYPNFTGGFTEDQARYATANAIRFWVAERGCDGSLAWMNLNNYWDFFRAKPGYEDLWWWCIGLLGDAETMSIVEHNAYIIPTTPTITEDGDYFVFTTTIYLDNCEWGYTIDKSTLPAGTTISGYTADTGDKLTIKVPKKYASQTFELKIDAYDNRTQASLVFYAPNASNQQRIMAYTWSNGAEAADAAITVQLPNTAPQEGSIKITKTDADTGAKLSGVGFKIFDSANKEVFSGETDSDGVLTVSGLPLGKYYYQEVKPPAGYIADDTKYEIQVSEVGGTASVTVKNTPEAPILGSVTVTKLDEETKKPMAGVHFVLNDKNNNQLGGGNTNSEGKITFSPLELGDYILKETATLSGYVLDSTGIPVSVTKDTPDVNVTATNKPIRGGIEITKLDSADQTPLEGAGYYLYDKSGNKIAEGHTDKNGKLSFTNLAVGEYSYMEYEAPAGYIRDTQIYKFTVNETKLVAHSRSNTRHTGTIQLKKQASDGSALSGAAFMLEFSQDNGKSWQRYSGGQVTTGADGTATFTKLKADNKTIYRIIETKAPAGCARIQDPIYTGTLPVEVNKSNAEDSETINGKTYCYTLYVTVTDCPNFTLPNTGSNGFEYLPITLLLMTAAVYFVMMKRRKTE